MSAKESSSSALVAELSFSFQDELTATIQNALGVAVEIAVVEITKLVSQVLSGVKNQMHDTLRDNKSLKFRLQAAELELSSARDRLEERHHAGHGGFQGDSGSGVPMQRVNDQLTSLNFGRVQGTRGNSCESNGEMRPNHRVGGPSEVKEIFNVLEEQHNSDSSTFAAETFHEIREDGSVCTQDIKKDVSEEHLPERESQDRQVTKEEQLQLYACIQTDSPQFPEELSAVRSHRESAGGHNKVPQATEVKVEASAMSCSADCASGSGSAADEEDFVAHSLSLVQSQLLEDWRPDPLELQGCETTDALAPHTSRAVADSPIFPADLPELALMPPSGSGHPYHTRHQGPASSTSDPSLYPPAISIRAAPAQQPHACKVCGQTFRLGEELRRHRRKHVRSPKKSLFPPGRSPYHCSLCGRDFNRMEHLKIHQRIHTGERPYACSVCNARFRHSWALTRHFRIHTGEKPYVCGICGKTFRNGGGLRFHQRTHGLASGGEVP